MAGAVAVGGAGRAHLRTLAFAAGPPDQTGRDRAAGYDARRFSGHSGRVGLAREMASRDASTELIMRQRRWKSAEMVALYMRRAQAKWALKWLED